MHTILMSMAEPTVAAVGTETEISSWRVAATGRTQSVPFMTLPPIDTLSDISLENAFDRDAALLLLDSRLLNALTGDKNVPV